MPPSKRLSIACLRCFSSKLDNFISKDIHNGYRKTYLSPKMNTNIVKHKPRPHKMEFTIKSPSTVSKPTVPSSVGHLNQLLAHGQTQYALQLFLLCPKEFKTLKCASAFFDLANRAAEQKDPEALEKIGAVFEKALPNDFNKCAKLQLCHSEILWRNNNYPDALSLLTSVYKNYPTMRRKTRNYFSFLLHHGINNELIDYEIILEQVQNFAQNMSTTYLDHQPLVSIWKQGILSDMFVWRQASQDILKNGQNHESTIKMFTLRLRKILEDLRTQNEKDVGLIQRLVETSLRLDNPELQSAAFNLLLRCQCERTWVERAAETVKTAQLLNIRLDPELVQEHAHQAHPELRPDLPSSEGKELPKKLFSFKLKF